VIAEYPVSTSAFGVGGAEGSYRTPPGFHRVREMIGAGAPAGTVYVGRAPTGETWQGADTPDDLILTRILTLEGLEPGVNQGVGCDSLARYIYIHGTNHEQKLGTAASHGCIRMANRDVVDLFDRLKPGDPVVVA
jgi:UDP-N-acetylmuramate--alanine ligase